MKARSHIAATTALVLATAASSAALAQAGGSCNARHTVCLQSGKDETSCLSAWHQCKTAARTPARTATAPVHPVKVAAAAHH